jgi:HlyD family secretion protein
MGKIIRNITIVIFIAVIGVVTVILYSSPVKVDVITVAPTDMYISFTEDGIVAAKQDYDIISNVTGKVVQVFVSEGDYVEEGAVIAQIDSDDYLSQIEMRRNTISSYESQIVEATAEETNTKDEIAAKIAQLKTQLVQAESSVQLDDVNNISVLLPYAQLSTLELSIEECQLELDYAKDRYEAGFTLYQEGVIPKTEYDEYEQNYYALQNKMYQLMQKKGSLDYEINRLNAEYGENTLTALSDSAKSALKQATLDEIQTQISALENDMAKDYKVHAINSFRSLIAAEESMIEILERSVTDCSIKANRSGYIRSLPILYRTFAPAQSVVCTIKGDQDISIESYVSTKDIVNVSVGDTVDLIHKTSANDIAYTGIVTAIEGWAEERASTTTARQRRVKVEIQPKGDMETVDSGYELDVKFYSFKGEDCLVLPNSAFFNNGEADCVFVADRQRDTNEGVLRAVAIKKGVSANSETVILEGLQEGDIVVQDGSAQDIAETTTVSW